MASFKVVGRVISVGAGAVLRLSPQQVQDRARKLELVKMMGPGLAPEALGAPVKAKGGTYPGAVVKLKSPSQFSTGEVVDFVDPPAPPKNITKLVEPVGSVAAEKAPEPVKSSGPAPAPAKPQGPGPQSLTKDQGKK